MVDSCWIWNFVNVILCENPNKPYMDEGWRLSRFRIWFFKVIGFILFTMFLCSSSDFDKTGTTDGKNTKLLANNFQPSEKQQAKFQCRNLFGSWVTRLYVIYIFCTLCMCLKFVANNSLGFSAAANSQI